MRPRQPLPRLWLMTDERMGEGMWRALERLPAGSGVVFRHYSLSESLRRRLFDAVRRIARRRRLVLLLAGEARTARRWRADGVHGQAVRRVAGLLLTMPAHDGRELAAARRARADLVFLSPVFATRSHPGGAPLGIARFGLLRHRTPLKVVALGGMTARRARALARMDIHGWAAIDAWARCPIACCSTPAVMPGSTRHPAAYDLRIGKRDPGSSPG